MKLKLLALSVLTLLVLQSCQSKTKEQHTTKSLTPIQNSSVAYGIDISHHQNNEIDAVIQHTDSLSFIICKATEGVTYTDPKFVKNWKTIKAHNFLRGAYHFYQSKDNPVAQAAFFLEAISDIQHTDIPPIIDVEAGGIDTAQTVSEVQKGVRLFLNEIENKIKCKPIIYTDVHTANRYLNTAYFSKYALWIANYNGKTAPDLPKIWTSKGWLIWQKNQTYTFHNIVNDFDVFNGSLTAFKTFIANSYTGNK